MASYQISTLFIVLPEQSAEETAEKAIEHGTSSSSMLPNPEKQKSREERQPCEAQVPTKRRDSLYPLDLERARILLWLPAPSCAYSAIQNVSEKFRDKGH